ncbi:hypothetical protein KSP40_PGU006798 [Platanthera guangdongensis]|uniref:Uncharacterized protein n=1 Tax=Platanthera guangdongensis TaxID=2320717 RepID=A0ABR2MH40_9ASPA
MSLNANELWVDIAEAQVFKDSKWRGGTWDLVQFQKGGVTDWDAVIDAGRSIKSIGDTKKYFKGRDASCHHHPFL